MTEIKKILTIAGCDPSGGAGIAADLKVIAAHGMYGMCVITALTAQNTLSVKEISTVGGNFFREQLDSVLSDITPDAVKIGMTGSAENIMIISELLLKYKIKNIVVDPVLISTCGRILTDSESGSALCGSLFTIADIITPNIAETQVLCGFDVKNTSDMIKYSRFLSEKYGCAVLIKGGHLNDRADDILYENGESHCFYGRHIDNPNTHGTGCTLSSAIACGLASGLALPQAVQNAKEYITGAIAAGLDIGHGNGPLNHMYKIM